MRGNTSGYVWTEHKAKLIARYLRYFVFITKHGAYIDGFSAPKNDGNPDSWATNLVLASEPQWLRQFYLCDLPERIGALSDLAARQALVKNRTIEVLPGDFNETVHTVLGSPEISGKTATFCLLDQYTTECDWATVSALAQHKGPGFKRVELFYFLATGWLIRTLTAFQDTRRPDAWWGGPGWRELLEKRSTNQLVLAFIDRFQNELGYRFVDPYPIYEREGASGKIMFYMIHASHHQQAPLLMKRAYKSVIQPLEPAEQLVMELSGLADLQGPE